MCMAYPEGGAAMPENAGKAGGPKMFHMVSDDGKTGVVPGGWETEKLDGKWYRKNSIEAEGIRDRQNVQTGDAPPPDMVNNQPVGEAQFSLGDKLKGKHVMYDKKARAKKLEDLKVRLKGRSSQKDMTGNITQDADLREGGINI